ncbi:MAG: hypothetical protein SNJ59_01405 [Aggregatilineales bacterium]
MSKRRGISVVRIGIIAGVVGLLLIFVGLVSFFVDQASRRGPFEVAVHPEAEEWGIGNVTPTSRSVFYRVPDRRPEEVAAFYQQRMNEHYGDGVENCVRIPPSGELIVRPDVPNAIPYQFICMFDRSGFNATQFTRVIIYPGIYDPDPFFNAQGMTVIEYEQVWQP